MSRKSFITTLWVSFIIGMFFFIFFTPEKTFENGILTILISAVYSFTISFGNGFINDLLNRKFSWVEETKVRTILGIFSTVLVNAFLILLCNYANFIWYQKQNPQNFFKGNMATFNWLSLNIALLVSAVLHAKGFMEEWKKSAKKEVIEQKLIAKSANAQFESLKNQLDPHFLFNSLNVLSSLIDENPDQAQKFTSSMSKIYRYILEQKDKELISVEEELEFAKTYCELLKTRFEDAVNFEFNVKDEDKKKFVVPLSLQLLLENCIKHNFATSSKPLQINIFSENRFLIIENNLQERELMKEREGIGLSNIVQRYYLLTNLNVFIEKSEQFFRVKLPLLSAKTSRMETQTPPSDERLAYDKASKRVKEIKDFYGSLVAYCIIIPFLFLINWRTSPNYYWAFWPMFGWGIALAIKGLKIFGFSKDWEEKQIKKYMKKTQENY